MSHSKLNDLNSREDRIASIPVNKRMWEKMKEKYFEGVFRVYESVGVRNEQLKIYCLSDLLKYIKPMLPREVFVRQMHPDRVNGESVGNTKFVLVELVKWSYDSIDGIRIHIRRIDSERARLVAQASGVCYNPPVSGSMGGKKPEPQ